MSKKIKIEGDTSGLTKSVMDFAKKIQKDLGKSNIQLLDKDNQKFIKGEWKRHVKELVQEQKKLKSEYNDQLRELRKLKQGTKEYAEGLEKASQTGEKLTGVIEKISSLRSGGSALGGGGLLGGLGGIAGKIGSLMNPATLLMTGLAAAGGVAIGAGRRGMARYEQGAGTRLQLRARGVNDLRLEDARRAADAGLSEDDVSARRMRSMDIFGESGASQESVIRRAEFERAFGVEGGTLANVGAQLRGQLGGQGAEEQVMKLQASLIASGIEDAIGPYLQTAAEMLTSLNEQGPVQTTEMLSALSNLVETTGETPERIGKAFTSMQQSVQGATGERAALLQMAFADQGIGGGTLGGTRLAMQAGGLFGANLGAFGEGTFSGGELAAMGQLGIGAGDAFQKRSEAILDIFNKRGLSREDAENDPQAMAGRMRLGQMVTGIQNPVEAVAALNLLEKAQGGDSEARKEFEKMQKESAKTTEDRLKELNKSAEGQLTSMEKLRETIETEIGANLVGVNLGMHKALLSMDRGINALASTLAPDAYKDPREADKLQKELQSKRDLKAANVANLKEELKSASGPRKRMLEGSLAREQASIRQLDEQLSENYSMTSAALDDESRENIVSGKYKKEAIKPKINYSKQMSVEPGKSSDSLSLEGLMGVMSNVDEGIKRLVSISHESKNIMSKPKATVTQGNAKNYSGE